MKNIKIELKWALIFVVISLLWMVMEKQLGWHDEKIADHAWLTMLFLPVAVAVYVLALIDKRKNHYKGVMSWKQGFISGVIITVIVAALSPLTQYIISTYITPDYFKNVIAYAVAHDMYTQEDATAYFNLNNYIMQSVVWALIMGVVTSAIVAIFVKRKALRK